MIAKNSIVPLDEPMKDRNKPFTVVHEETLAATSMIILIRSKYAKGITDIRSSSLALGWFNKVANKGAVQINFSMARKRCLFINCHLEAHNENRVRR